MIEFDPNKNALNIAKHGISLAAAESFQWETALIAVDDRRDYGEERRVALGLLAGTLHVLVFTPRGAFTRAISLRRANQREIFRYEAARARF